MSVPKLKRRRLVRLGLAALPIAMATAAFAQALAPAPEGATGRTKRAADTATKYMVAAANPLAASAGRDILRAGGSAVDAAITVQLVLNLVEPQSSGIGGGAFILHWDKARQSLAALDGRETAPAAAKPDRFVGPDGKPLKFMEAVVGGPLGRGAGHRAGDRDRAQTLGQAALGAGHRARDPPGRGGLCGLAPPQRPSDQETALRADPVARAYFYEPDGSPKPVGAVLKSPAFAETLRAIARGGADAFYDGPIAQDILATVTGHPTNAGDMTAADLKSYSGRGARPGLRPLPGLQGLRHGPAEFGRGRGAADSQHARDRDLARMGQGPEAAHWIAEAGRLAYADRAMFVGDPAFVNVPLQGLIDPGYLKNRAALVNPDKSMGRAVAGEPPFQKTFRYAPSEATEFGTSHISVVDGFGNAVAMTTTIEDGFGARIMTKAGSCSTTNSPTSPSRPPRATSRSRTGSRAASARAPRWPRPWCSTPSTGSIWSPGSPGRQPDHQLRAKTLWAARLEARPAAGGRPAEHGQPQRPDGAREGAPRPRLEGGARGQGPRGPS
jgi:gamma-glutamyltranspeptidase/glutathione hydrolase